MFPHSAITPGHSHPPQPAESSPANLTLSSSLVVPGGKITVQLSPSDNSTFKGFIIQARDAQLKDQQVREEVSDVSCIFSLLFVCDVTQQKPL